MAEFCSEDFEILLHDGMQIKVYKLGELLPVSFTKSNLE
jgi:cytidine deaminase